MKLTRAQRRDLERLFVRSLGGRARLLAHAATISPVTSLRRLHSLQQMGLLTYSDIPDFYARFGVLGWMCELAPCARDALERELELEAKTLRDGEGVL